eukprot:TRINITY_DN2040_c0_g1_i1.p1 TRINITY_DN2040_c0_g1~~TRINITY_DN2040_c0_g1_i1.p1  ORF type:complete len:113 (-),score=25.50 TRINITY_DN2040_c0_g1_i1:47-385(-)
MPLYKALFMIVRIGGNTIFRSLASAYKEALNRANQTAAAGVQQAPKLSLMTVSEAKKILGLEGPATSEEIYKQYQTLFEANDPAKGGSPYLRSKVEGAKETIEDQLRKGGSV